ncbi:LOW QUALITY PROTEIN: uncharacterized protein EMH_0005210 [Eimeria mitis]|uniref:Uncharacterized protein n=1 Tax=Eimeria mitis TaxID=44415 RepID=U6K2H1_9EIME|nr:LOW QUALITY PROTEIN: uncharacterized protein EMH_0005210 [Eimeria mitis]CDJ29968.1 hypothetical protein EMH_0005210 [Eimeria mitis]
MGIPWRSARAWLWKALDPHEATGEATAPELDNADAGEEVAKKDGASSPWKSSGKQIGAAKVMILGFLVILVSGARFIMSKRSRPNVTAPHLPVDDASMEHYLDDFNKAADEMKNAWESSVQPVRRAFQLHFTPSLEEGQELPQDPLAAISEHVAKMRDCEVPSASPVEARNDFAQHLQLLHSICRIVRLRLDELKWFVLVNERIKVPVPVPGYDTPYSYPALEVLEGKVEGGLTATSFLKSVGLFGGEPTQQVDERITLAS